MDDFRLTNRQIAKLKKEHRKQRDKRFAYRLHAIILLGSGWSVTEVAEVLFVDETTVRNWLTKYRDGGKDALLELHYQMTGFSTGDGIHWSFAELLTELEFD